MIVNTASLVEDYDHVYSNDPSIDKSKDGFEDEWKAFLESCDVKRLCLKAGQEPAIWRLGHIRGKAKRLLRNYIQDTAVNEMISEAAAYYA